MSLYGLRVEESPYLQGRFLIMGGTVYVPSNRTGWAFGWYMRVMLCGDIRWEREP